MASVCEGTAVHTGLAMLRAWQPWAGPGKVGGGGAGEQGWLRGNLEGFPHTRPSGTVGWRLPGVC